MKFLPLLALAPLASLSQAATITAITAITTDPLPNTDSNTQIESSGKLLTSITTGGITYTDVNLIDSHTLDSNAGNPDVVFFARGATVPAAPSVADIYTDLDISQGLANAVGDAFFDGSYNSGDIMYFLEIGGTDAITITLLGAGAAPVSDPFATTISADTGYDLRFRTTNSTTNDVDQNIVGLALTEDDFTNVTGPVTGVRIGNGVGNTNGTDFTTIGHVNVIPEPSTALLGLLIRRR